MTTYTAISASQTDPGAPITAALAKAWADNALAIVEGDPTAPDLMLGIARRNLYGGIGSYVFARFSGGHDLLPGALVGGSQLNPVSAVMRIDIRSTGVSSSLLQTASSGFGGGLAGVWRTHGFFTNSVNFSGDLSSSIVGSFFGATLFFRVT